MAPLGREEEWLLGSSASGVANKGGPNGRGGGAYQPAHPPHRDSGFALRSMVITPSATGRCRGKLVLIYTTHNVK